MRIEQCRAGRALLGWSAQELADAARIGVATVRRFEGGSAVNETSVAAAAGALMAAGIIFVADGEASTSGGPGVRLVAS